MKKRNRLFFVLIAFLLIFAFLFHVRAASALVYNIVTCPAEDMATSMQVNFQSDPKLKNLDVQYTVATDKDFKEATIQDGGEAKVFQRTNDTPRGAYYVGMDQPRLVYNAVLENLEPETKYQYRIVEDGEVYSDPYFFETGSEEFKPFSFVFMTDPQYASEKDSQVFNDLAEARIAADDVKFAFLTGDLSDRGGNDNLWRMFFDKSSIKKIPYVTTVGNHEYYDKGTHTIDNSIYNNYWFNPQNGPEDIKGSAYYCVYNDCLFVMLDSEEESKAGGHHKEQEEWFREVCRNNPCSYLIVGEHRSAYAGAKYYDVGRTFLKNWGKTFDECAVDLVLSGHDHIYARTKLLYADAISKNDLVGTTYILGGAAGTKHYALSNTTNAPKWACQFDLSSKEAVCTLITLGEDGISGKAYNLDGKIKDSFTQKRKRFGTVDPNFTKEAFEDTLKVTRSEGSLKEAEISWDKLGYGYVQSIAFTDLSKNNYLGSKAFLNEISLSKKVPILLGEINKIKAEIYYNDKTKGEKILTFDNTIPWGEITDLKIDEIGSHALKFSWNQNINTDYTYLNYIEIYRDGMKAKKINLTPKDFTKDTFAFDLDRSLEPLKTYDIKIEVLNVNENVVLTKTFNVTMAREISDEEAFQNQMAECGLRFMLNNFLNLLK